MRARRPGTPQEPVKEFEDYEHFESSGEVPSGRFVIPYNGVPVDFLYEPVEGAKATVVTFHGSTKKDVNLPIFAGNNIMKGLPANRLAICDPSITLDSSHELILSWFMGSSQQPRLQFFLETTIRRIKEITGAPRLIFFGSSGGGFASLEMSRRFPGSVVFAMNPQTNLQNYYWPLRDRYLELCWNGMTCLDELPAFVNHDLIDIYPSVLNNTVAYVQNTRDKHHIENHQLPFLDKVGGNRRVFSYMGAWGDPHGKGHVAAPKEVVRPILEKLIDSRGAWRDALLDLGFTQRPVAESVLATVKQANKGLPTDHEKDDM